MNTNLYDREGFQEKVVPIRTEEDRYACLKLLVGKHRHMTLCQSRYSEEHIKTIIEDSTALLYYHPVGAIEEIVCFALVAHRKPKLEIRLTCAVPNTQRFGNMIAYLIFSYAIQKRCKKMTCVPRTPQLRDTFLRHGFVHYHGTKGIDEVLEKQVAPLRIRPTRHTRHARSRKNHTTVRNKPLRVNHESVGAVEANGAHENRNPV
jgi:hypothetical protein